MTTPLAQAIGMIGQRVSVRGGTATSGTVRAVMHSRGGALHYRVRFGDGSFAVVPINQPAAQAA